MPNNLTDAEIIKEATEVYNQNLNAGCYVGVLLRIINRQEQELRKCENVERLADKTIATLQAENESLKAEVERLKRSINISQHLLSNAYDSIEQLSNFIENIKAEAYKEIIELAKSRKRIVDVSPTFGYEVFEEVVTIKDIDNLLNEKLGGTNEL